MEASAVCEARVLWLPIADRTTLQTAARTSSPECMQLISSSVLCSYQRGESAALSAPVISLCWAQTSRGCPSLLLVHIAHQESVTEA